MRFNASPMKGRSERNLLSLLVRTAPQDQCGERYEPSTDHNMSCIVPHQIALFNQDQALLHASRSICMFCDKLKEDSSVASDDLALLAYVLDCRIRSGRGHDRNHHLRICASSVIVACADSSAVGDGVVACWAFVVHGFLGMNKLL